MVTGRPMFPGSTVKEELHLIFRLLGESSAVSQIPTRGQWLTAGAVAKRSLRSLEGAQPLGKALQWRGQAWAGVGRRGQEWAGVGSGCLQPSSRLAVKQRCEDEELLAGCPVGCAGESQPARNICALSLLGRILAFALLSAPNEDDRFPSLPLSGTPTEDTWPGITSNEEFKAYNFTQYRAQPLINHAPRYLLEQGHVRHGGLALVVNRSLGRPVSFPPWGAGSF